MLSSHQVPVEAFSLHLAHQVHQAPLEENLKAQIVFHHQGCLQAALDNLSIKTGAKTICVLHRNIVQVLRLSTAARYLFPDVVVRQEAAQLSFCQGPAVVGVVVARQHVDPHTLDLTHVHGSKIHSKLFCYPTKQGVVLVPFRYRSGELPRTSILSKGLMIYTPHAPPTRFKIYHSFIHLSRS